MPISIKRVVATKHFVGLPINLPKNRNIPSVESLSIILRPSPFSHTIQNGLIIINQKQEEGSTALLAQQQYLFCPMTIKNIRTKME
jgi:hypothetical protein